MLAPYNAAKYTTRAKSLLPATVNGLALAVAGAFQVIVGAAGAAPGTVSTGTLVGGSGTLPADTTMVFTSAPFVYNAANLNSQLTTTYNGTAITYNSSAGFSDVAVGFTTSAQQFGVLCYAGTFAGVTTPSPTSVQAFVVDASGNQTSFGLHPQTIYSSASPGIVYFRFNTAPSSPQNIVVRVSNFYGGIVVPTGAIVTPYDFTASAPTMGVCADSWGWLERSRPTASGLDGTYLEVARKLGIFGVVCNSITGNSYGQTDQITVYPASQTWLAPAQAKVDVMLFVLGINDALGTLSGYWTGCINDFKAAHPGCLLVVVSPQDNALANQPPNIVAKQGIVNSLIQQVGGKWIYMDCDQCKWFTSAGTSGTLAPNTALFTGSGYIEAPVSGTASTYIQSAHPSKMFRTALSAAAAINATTLSVYDIPALGAATVNGVPGQNNTAGALNVGRCIAPSGKIAIVKNANNIDLSATTTTIVAYNSVTQWAAGAGITALQTINLSTALTQAYAVGDLVFTYDNTFSSGCGCDYWADWIARCIAAANASM